MTRITFLSDTHNKHLEVVKDLPGGDFIIHCGDITPIGDLKSIKKFCKWYNELEQYTYKIFIAGNHDYAFERLPNQVKEILDYNQNIIYLQDNYVELMGLKIYGSPWQPEFYDWAFNLPRNGELLLDKWNKIPTDVDILITHAPPFGNLDKMEHSDINLGCELLAERVNVIKPKIHVFGHIHTGRGYKLSGHTNFINASVLNESYNYTQKPMTVDWNKNTNKISFIIY